MNEVEKEAMGKGEEEVVGGGDRSGKINTPE